jgi:hypothetical protein
MMRLLVVLMVVLGMSGFASAGWKKDLARNRKETKKLDKKLQKKMDRAGISAKVKGGRVVLKHSRDMDGAFKAIFGSKNGGGRLGYYNETKAAMGTISGKGSILIGTKKAMQRGDHDSLDE